MYPQELTSRSSRAIYTHMFAALHARDKMGKQLECPWMDTWIVKKWYIHTIRCYFVIKRNEARIHAAMGVDLEDIMLNEINQTRKNKYCVILWVESKIVQYTVGESKMVTAKGWGKGKMGRCWRRAPSFNYAK